MPATAVTYEFLSAGRGTAPGGATARVHAALREAIVQLDFRPGEFLDKQAIAARMGVSRFPVRVKCASLSWHTLKAALDSESVIAPVSTE
jgi:DNA-binding GntR family transcriptional regulator